MSNIGDYTGEEVAAMDAEAFKAAQAAGFKKVAASNSVEQPLADPDNVWRSNKSKSSNDFICPSGQRCRLRVLTPESLVEQGILDKVTRLEGLAQTLVDRAEGQPPEKLQMPSRVEMEDLLQVINIIVPLAVAEPKVFQPGAEDAGPDAIFVTDIDLMDRVAIMEHALRGVRMLDKFRPAG